VETYQSLPKLDDQGASYMASGMADLALFEGRLSDAARIFDEGAAADLRAKDTGLAAFKLVALAQVQAMRGDTRAAIAAAQQALQHDPSVKVRFLAARVFVDADAIDRARPLASALQANLQAEPQAYAKAIEGHIAMKSHDPRLAIKQFSEANGLLDTWIGHFDLGRAYLEAGAFAQADSEFDRCLKRRGEALSLFLDEEPTWGALPPLYYYQGRTREGLNSTRYTESYRAYLDIRGTSTEDPLVQDARIRVGR
jgi:tetratricopeptide (TPR) repeat protein